MFRNCPECGRLFQGVAGQSCAICIEEMEAELRLVRDYLDEHPKATLEQVSRGTGLSADRITNLIKRGYVLAETGSALGPTCRSCGQPTDGSLFCPACTTRLEGEIEAAVKDRSTTQRMFHTWKGRGERSGYRDR